MHAAFRALLPAVLIGFSLLSGCGQPPRMSTLRVMSFNIKHAEGMDAKVDLQRIADVIRAAQPDLVALQEVDRGTARTRQVDQPAELGRLTGMQSLFEKNIPYQGGEYGNAILSRLPIEQSQNHLLPQLRAGEQRGALTAVVRANGRRLTFVATHFDYHAGDEERLASADLLLELFGSSSEAVVVAGDLNAKPESEVLRKLLSWLAEPPYPGEFLTFPADKPDRKIDYILYRPHAGLRPLGYSVIQEAVASDHRPIMAVFELAPTGTD